jgi:hypothetical protein
LTLKKDLILSLDLTLMGLLSRPIRLLTQGLVRPPHLITIFAIFLPQTFPLLLPLTHDALKSVGRGGAKC